MGPDFWCPSFCSRTLQLVVVVVAFWAYFPFFILPHSFYFFFLFYLKCKEDCQSWNLGSITTLVGQESDTVLLGCRQ